MNILLITGITLMMIGAAIVTCGLLIEIGEAAVRRQAMLRQRLHLEA